MAPSRYELLEIAERALNGVRDDAQATAWWERQLSAGAGQRGDLRGAVGRGRGAA